MIPVCRLRSQYAAGVTREEQLSIELAQQRADRLRIEAKLKASLLEFDQLRKESLAKNEKLMGLAGVAVMEKSLQGDPAPNCLLTSVRGDKLQMQLADVKAYKHKLRQSHHELQLAELNCMAEWSSGFYSGFDKLVEVVMDKFFGVDLLGLKAEDYAEVPVVEFGGVNLKVTVKGEGTGGVVLGPMSANSPLPIPDIWLANPLAVDASLTFIDQAALSLMVISGGGLDGQVTPSLRGKEVAATLEGAMSEPVVFKIGRRSAHDACWGCSCP